MANKREIMAKYKNLWSFEVKTVQIYLDFYILKDQVYYIKQIPMSQKENKQSQILYEDQSVKISENSVMIRRFYIPHDNVCQIPFKNIKHLDLREMGEMDQALGVPESYFKDFKKRVQEGKNVYIQMTTEENSVRLSFAPEQPIRVMQLIEKKWQQVKKEQSKTSSIPLTENSLYQNVQITAEKVSKVMEQLKKSQEVNELESKQNEHKRENVSPSVTNKQKDIEDRGSPKKKVKQNEMQSRVHQTQNPPEVKTQ